MILGQYQKLTMAGCQKTFDLKMKPNKLKKLKPNESTNFYAFFCPFIITQYYYRLCSILRELMKYVKVFEHNLIISNKIHGII